MSAREAVVAAVDALVVVVWLLWICGRDDR